MMGAEPTETKWTFIFSGLLLMLLSTTLVLLILSDADGDGTDVDGGVLSVGMNVMKQ